MFSATLSKDLQRNVKKRSRGSFAGNKKDKSPSTLGEYRHSSRWFGNNIDDACGIQMIFFYDSISVIPNLKWLILAQRVGSYRLCRRVKWSVYPLRRSDTDHYSSTSIYLILLLQDVYLYYFLLRYPGRSLVFLSSIDGIRRLMPLAELLGLKAFPLHSQLEQRQRLKNLDRQIYPSFPRCIIYPLTDSNQYPIQSF